MKTAYLFFIVFMVANCAVAAPNVLKWVDKDGKVHYGDPASAGTIPEPVTAAKPLKKPQELDSQSWNRAVDNAEKAPTGSSGRSLGRFANPDPVPVPSRVPYPRNPSYSGNYGPRPSDALVQQEAERNYERQRRQQVEAGQNTRQELIANCERQRGTNCRDSETLRYMENANKPRGAFR